MSKRTEKMEKRREGIPAPIPQGTFVGNSPDLERMFQKFKYFSAWSSPESFTRYVKQMDQNKAWNDSAWTHDKNFTGTESMQEALTMAQGEWKEGADMIEKLHGRIMALNPMLVKPIKYDVVGSYPNVPRAIAGNPLNMRKNDDALSRRRPVITLVSDMGANCGVDHKAITNRAAVVTAIIDHIEASGFACEVISGACSAGGMWGNSDHTAATVVVAKQSYHPVDISRLAFSLGHASMFRRLIFADWEYASINKNGLGRSLGHHFDFEVDNEKGIYVIPSSEGNVEKFFKDEQSSITKGLEYIINSLREQGCPVFKKD